MNPGWGLLAAAPVGWVLAAGLVYALPQHPARRWLVALLAAAGSGCLAAGAILTLTGVFPASSLEVGSWGPLGAARFSLDALSAYFLAITGCVSALLFIARPGVLPAAGGRTPLAAIAVLLVSLEVVFTAGTVFVFLLGWEGLGLAFYLTVAAGYRQAAQARPAAYWTFGMARLGGAAVMGSLLILAAGAGSLDFEALPSAAGGLGAVALSAVLALALAGFGVKIALVPFQSWLPRAYPAAPAGTPAFLAALGLNAGFYGLIRVFSALPAGPAWWGCLLVLVGAATAFLGILYAAAQTDLKALISYSSVENAGIIACALGVYLIGRTAHLDLLAGLALAAALFQIAVHATAKAALFVVADGVQRHAETLDMEHLGGLAKGLPGLFAVFVLAAGSLVGLPPTGGFTSEWLVLETLMQGFRTGGLLPEVSMALAGSLLALTAALAGIAFVKALFGTFLGLPRGHRPAVEVGGATAVAGSVLAGIALATGVLAPWFAAWIASAAASAGAPDVAAKISVGGWLVAPVYPDFSSISPTELALVIPAFALLVAGLVLVLRDRSLPVRRTELWTSGEALPSPRHQYTPTAWSNPTRVVFDTVLRTKRVRRAHGPRLSPVRIEYASRIPDLTEDLIVLPLVRSAVWLAGRFQALQSGSVSRYLLYVLAVVVLMLLALLAR